MTEEESFAKAIDLVERFVSAHEDIATALVNITTAIERYTEMMREGDRRIIASLEADDDDEQEPRQ